jgi:hypothetical protein
MTNKQAPNSLYSPDGSKYGAITDGAGNLVIASSSSLGTTKQLYGSQAPDSSIYFTLTNGSGTLV